MPPDTLPAPVPSPLILDGLPYPLPWRAVTHPAAGTASVVDAHNLAVLGACEPAVADLIAVSVNTASSAGTSVTETALAQALARVARDHGPGLHHDDHARLLLAHLAAETPR